MLDSPATFEITNRSSTLQNLAMADTLSGPLDPPIKGGKCSKTSILFHELFFFNPFVILASMSYIYRCSTKPELFSCVRKQNEEALFCLQFIYLLVIFAA